MSTVTLNLQTDIVELPVPSLTPSIGLEQALKNRRSWRSFLPDALPLEMLSALLWSGCGVNRRDSGGRTAPSAHNWKEIDVYAVLPEGTFRYDPTSHRLMLVKACDLRSETGTQDFVGQAPLNLLYVADFARMTGARPEEREFLAGVDAGCIAQNVYLFCSCVGLATVVRGLIDRRRLAAALGLAPTERIALAQSVGRAGAA